MVAGGGEEKNVACYSRHYISSQVACLKDNTKRGRKRETEKGNSPSVSQ